MTDHTEKKQMVATITLVGVSFITTITGSFSFVTVIEKTRENVWVKRLFPANDTPEMNDTKTSVTSSDDDDAGYLHRMMCVIAQENINTAKKARETINM